VGLVIFTFTVRLKQAKDLFFKHLERFDGFVEFQQFGIVQSPPVWNIDKKYNYYDKQKKYTAFKCAPFVYFYYFSFHYLHLCSIHQDSNPRPFGHEPCALTTRPGLLAHD
jgi:hypothetical protein